MDLLAKLMTHLASDSHLIILRDDVREEALEWYSKAPVEVAYRAAMEILDTRNDDDLIQFAKGVLERMDNPEDSELFELVRDAEHAAASSETLDLIVEHEAAVDRLELAQSCSQTIAERLDQLDEIERLRGLIDDLRSKLT
jgi:hypothetical protein